MATKKDGGKNKKFGRNRDRNPSSKLQSKRSERNKIKRLLAVKIVHNPPRYGKHQLHGRSKEGKWLWMTVSFGAERKRIYCM